MKLLTDSFFDMKIRENPWFATSLGLNLYQDKIEEWNYEAFNRRVVSIHHLLLRLSIAVTHCSLLHISPKRIKVSARAFYKLAVS